MAERNDGEDLRWQPTWGQAMSDFRGENDEPGFDNVTVRMTVPASVGGSQMRVELSNRFGDEPVRIGRAAIGVNDHFVQLAFAGQPVGEIHVERSVWTDPVELVVHPGDAIVVDLYLPEPTPYATAAGFRFDRSTHGDVVGARRLLLEGSTSEGSTPEGVDESREFPAPNTGTDPEPDGTGWSLPAGGPFLRTIEVAGIAARAVIVALGGSSTAMGWPQYTAEFLPADSAIAVVNRGISGNRILLDGPPSTPSWGRSGLSRFDEDVLETAGVTHVVISYNSNDWGLPGRVTSLNEMPTVAQLIEGYQELIDRARIGGLEVILTTITPLSPELRADPGREEMRLALNEWIRASGNSVVDFDAAIRSHTDPSRLEPGFAAPDDTHPNVAGEKRLARAMVREVALWEW